MAAAFTCTVIARPCGAGGRGPVPARGASSRTPHTPTGTGPQSAGKPSLAPGHIGEPVNRSGPPTMSCHGSPLCQTRLGVGVWGGWWRIRVVACPKGGCPGSGRSRWIAESSPSALRARRFARFLIAHHAGVDDVGEPSFQRTHSLHRGLPGGFLCVVVGAALARSLCLIALPSMGPSGLASAGVTGPRWGTGVPCWRR